MLIWHWNGLSTPPQYSGTPTRVPLSTVIWKFAAIQGIFPHYHIWLLLAFNFSPGEGELHSDFIRRWKKGNPKGLSLLGYLKTTCDTFWNGAWPWMIQLQSYITLSSRINQVGRHKMAICCIFYRDWPSYDLDMTSAWPLRSTPVKCNPNQSHHRLPVTNMGVHYGWCAVGLLMNLNCFFFAKITIMLE